MVLCDFDPIFELLSLSKTVSTASQATMLQNPFLHKNIGDGILPQALQGGTSLNGSGEAHKIFLSDHSVTVVFVYSRWRSTVTDTDGS